LPSPARRRALTPRVKVVQDGDCVLTMPLGVDCFTSAPAGAVQCAWTGAKKDHAEAALATCRSIVIQ